MHCSLSEAKSLYGLPGQDTLQNKSVLYTPLVIPLSEAFKAEGLTRGRVITMTKA